MAFKRPLPEWNNPGVEPPQSKKDMGWLGREKPPAQWHNWFQHLTYEALKELQENAAHVTFGNTPPASPDVNDLWVDTSEEPPVLKRFDGTQWTEIGKGGVSSVNGKTGDVVLTAEDIGAASSDALNEHLNEIASTNKLGHVIVDNFGLRVDDNGVLSLKNNEVINLTINSNSDIKKVLESIPQGVAARVIVSETSEDNPIVIDQPIYLMGKNILLYSTSRQYVRVTAPIYLINSFFSFNNFDIHADGVIFQASGISGLMCGAYYYNRIYPLTATSNVSFLRMNGIGNTVLTNPSLISVNLLRTIFATDNFSNYSGTFKVFDRYDEYNAQILLSRQWQVTLQPNVSWGLTEYTLAGNLKYYQ